MWQFSPTASGLLVQDHTMATRVEVWHGGQAVAELAVYTAEEQLLAGWEAVTEGKVDSAADRAILANLQVTLVDPDGSLSRTDVGELLSPYDVEVVPYRGVLLPSGRAEVAPLGVFQLTGSDVADSPTGVTVALTGQDRALGYQTPLPRSVAIAAGTPVQDGIAALLTAVNPAFSWLPWVTGHTCGPLLFDTSDEAWAQALSLAESVGGWLYHDRLGECQLVPFASTVTPTAVEYVEGGGLLIDVTRKVNADDIRNVVVVQSSSTVIGATIVAVAEDTDPTSPTYAGAGRPRRVLTVVNENITSQAQAQDAATARLVQELGRSEEVALTVVTNPGVDVGDYLLVDRPRAGLLERRLVVSGTTVGLDCQSSMPVTVRKSILAQDGRIIDAGTLAA